MPHSVAPVRILRRPTSHRPCPKLALASAGEPVRWAGHLPRHKSRRQLNGLRTLCGPSSGSPRGPYGPSIHETFVSFNPASASLHGMAAKLLPSVIAYEHLGYRIDGGG